MLAASEPLSSMVASCVLDSDAARVLTLLVQVELDEEVQRAVESALGSPGARRLTLGLLHQSLGPDAVAEVAPDAALARAELIITTPSATAFTDSALALDPRVVWSAMDDRSLDPALPLGTLTVSAEFNALADDLTLVHGQDRIRRLQQCLSHTSGIAFIVCSQPDSPQQWRALIRQAGLLGHSVVLELTGDLSALGKYYLERADHISWSLSSPEPQHLAALPDRPWTEVDSGHADVDETDLSAVFGEFDLAGRRLTATQLHQASVAMANLGDPELALARLSAGPIGSMLERVQPRFDWDDLVLPSGQLRRLRALAARYRHRNTVHQQWGLAQWPSPGLVTLFSGPSGTGKTMSAEVIAHELGVDLLRVDLQAVVSKYIGETEKQLEQVFQAASAGDSVLLFDEADSLFGSRSKVSDARDRYANLEVSYLLQRLETYPGFVVLTTNFAGNIDAAFTRRIHASVHFQLPAASEREQIWRRALAQAPLADVDLSWAATSFDLSGGSIRNAALATAFLAAGDGGVVETRHVVGGLVEELVKLGRRPSQDLFGPYWSMLEA